ncbi:MAG: monomeric [FeFe] hydrogenase, partial [Endomicrobium sp.]|nr:monomeric [FeFe] hydrogenase [Endomicrobium sp.]
MRKFNTTIQMLKYKVLKEVARNAFEDTLVESITDIPKAIIPGNKASLRCCVYKERAILAERVKLAIGGDKRNPNVIEVINIACDECPAGGYNITSACRGCIAHQCKEVCPKDAIMFDRDQKAYIDKTKCVECGLCAKSCPYSAIADYKRPCEKACKAKAIHMGQDNAAVIKNDKCVACGVCISKCPFGAIMDKSFILNLVDILKKSKNNEEYKVYAVVAPAVAGQFNYANTSQVISGLKKLGFCGVFEAALGADMIAYKEAEELKEKGFLTTSCCPAFVNFVKKHYPDMSKNISTNLSPMAEISRRLKEKEPSAKIVFIGPCTAKKLEIQQPEVCKYVDCAITFEELQALFDSREIEIETLEEETVDDASYFGRIFARSGGVAEAVKEALKEQSGGKAGTLAEETNAVSAAIQNDFVYKPIVCSGLDSCKTAVLKASKNLLPENFIEGMACQGGCVSGAG